MENETSGRLRDKEESKDSHTRHRHLRSKHGDVNDEEDRRRSEDHSHRHRRSSRHETKIDREEGKDQDTRLENVSARENSVEKKKRKERGESEGGSDKRTKVAEENGRRRPRFDDVVGKEGDFEKKNGDVLEFGEKPLRRDSKLDSRDGEIGQAAYGLAVEPITMPSSTSSGTVTTVFNAPSTKVSSMTYENKGVNNSRSHEVHGTSSTDETALDPGKKEGFSLDALAKAKRALQMQKELAERMKKIPSLNRNARAAGEGTSKVVEKGAMKISSSINGKFPPTSPPVTASATDPIGSLPKTSNVPVTQSTAVPAGNDLPHLVGLTSQKYEAVKRAQELAAKMGFRQDPEFAPLINMFPGQIPPEVTIQPKPSKVPVLRLDALGREIDEHGNVVNISKVNSLSTLKVNINKQKKDAFQILKPELEVDLDENPHFDAAMGIDKNKLLRPKRMTFQFVEEGKWSKDAEIIKLKSQFGEAKAKELKTKQTQLAKAKSELDINPNLIEVGERVVIKREKPKESIPEVEWWDVPFLPSGAYGDVVDGNIDGDHIKMEKMTIYVEHPKPIEPPAEPAPPPPQPLKLTKKEQKKLRTQRRLARERDKQEMIRLGVLEPPKPKVKMSNLMTVLGSEATQDPTKLEMEIRSAAAEREQAHIDRNVARKLTPVERREKKERKLFDDSNSLETIVSVYKINDLSHPQARFKVDINAQENRLTGCAVISEGISIVVVEGGAKSVKRYGKLMLKRIDWAASVTKDEDDENDDEDRPVNKCMLVWQGSAAKPSFSRFFVQECRSETAARKFFLDHGVAHYWDLAVNFNEDLV